MLVLESGVRKTLVTMLKVARELPTGSDAADHLPINPWGDVEKFRRGVYVPLHGEEPSAPRSVAGLEEVFVEAPDVPPIRNVVDRLAENFSGGSPWVAPTIGEREAIETLLSRIGSQG